MFNFNIIKLLWSLWLVIGIIIIARIFFELLLPKLFHNWKNKRGFKRGQGWRSDNEYIMSLRDYSPSCFEDYIAWMFKEMGFKTESVGGSHDGGIDVIAEKNGIKHYIQCKKYYRWKVTEPQVREFYGALVDHLAKGKGYIITTSVFTREAERFAEDKPIELVDQFKLIQWRKLINKNL
ncbi:restriction endonuclease [Candidatus Wolfebacteria bacterium]|nr:restriction endonuclease [Candidatus Wolfebacteria bacterium]